MTEANAFYPTQDVDAKRVDGFIYHFVVTFVDEGLKSASSEQLYKSVPGIIFADANASMRVVISAICRNISQAGEISERLRDLDGVSEVRANILEDITYVRKWMTDAISARLQA